MFRYYNNNPLSREEEDCVTRAITLASGLSYAEVQDKLYYMARLLDCEELCVCCYKNLLDNIFCYPRLQCSGMTVGEIADDNPEGTLLVRIDGHLTCIVDGIIRDLWDCSDRYADIVWKVA
jgi:hypothetical protein